MKTDAPGGIATDFAGRSLVLTQHAAYGEAMGKVFAAFTNPERRANGYRRQDRHICSIRASTCDAARRAAWSDAARSR